MAPQTQFTQDIQTADWKSEKHVPAIECDDRVPKGQFFEVKVTIGKAVSHPNTTEHHIRWITLYFHPEGGKFTHQVGHFEFTAHGECTEGPNKGPIYTNHEATVSMKTDQGGTLEALSYCNIHGLWQSTKQIQVE